MSAVLEVSGVSKRFGAFRALTDVTFDVREGETLGLIGPNGAGKTTLFNIITGFLRPDAGGLHYGGEAIDHLSPERRVSRGMVRTFQKSMVFPELTVRENIAMAARQRAGVGLRWGGAQRRLGAAEARVHQLIGDSGLRRSGGERMSDLSYGEQRIVDLLISLALEPRLLLLDEPTAGLAQEEAERLLQIVRHHDARTSVVLIAHDIDIVFGACDRIAVLNLGQVLCCGTPEVVRADASVRAAYLGALADS
ncbi:branched-chain amino acid transport system ATP-binding protein [Roseomonas rosea]|uniref:Branched-chain amino acid transport system ATP-binding protein n=1 Tax=Muricoccus roseus TaxID=198092 RepID=A0A1M6IYQ2_9PROT|nr:ATP-binding cassette domain-containing protein [Roseomonas rosea]SHJ39584.1 branched-chain amino acid transport system ATP-binding protein [Roseomonas rosea]